MSIHEIKSAGIKGHKVTVDRMFSGKHINRVSAVPHDKSKKALYAAMAIVPGDFKKMLKITLKDIEAVISAQ